MSNPDSGFIYILSNEELPNLLKIGRTIGSIKTRALQIKSDMGLDSYFKIEHVEKVEDHKAVEKSVHQLLKERNVPLTVTKDGSQTTKREFFEVDLSEALDSLFSVTNKPSAVSVIKAQRMELLERDLEIAKLKLEIGQLKETLDMPF